MNSKKLFQILNGPSLMDLTLSLVLFPEQRAVVFKTNGNMVVDIDSDVCVRLSSLGVEDGSGNNWLIEGYAKPYCDEKPFGKEFRVKGYYNTKRREGHLEKVA